MDVDVFLAFVIGTAHYFFLLLGKPAICCPLTSFLGPLVKDVCGILGALLGQGCLLEPLDGGQVLGEAVLPVLLVLCVLYILLTELALGEHGLLNLVATKTTGAQGE